MFSESEARQSPKPPSTKKIVHSWNQELSSSKSVAVSGRPREEPIQGLTRTVMRAAVQSHERVTMRKTRQLIPVHLAAVQWSI